MSLGRKRSLIWTLQPQTKITCQRYFCCMKLLYNHCKSKFLTNIKQIIISSLVSQNLNKNSRTHLEILWLLSSINHRLKLHKLQIRRAVNRNNTIIQRARSILMTSYLFISHLIEDSPSSSNFQKKYRIAFCPKYRSNLHCQLLPLNVQQNHNERQRYQPNKKLIASQSFC